MNGSKDEWRERWMDILMAGGMNFVCFFVFLKSYLFTFLLLLLLLLLHLPFAFFFHTAISDG